MERQQGSENMPRWTGAFWFDTLNRQFIITYTVIIFQGVLRRNPPGN